MQTATKVSVLLPRQFNLIDIMHMLVCLLLGGYYGSIVDNSSRHEEIRALQDSAPWMANLVWALKGLSRDVGELVAYSLMVSLQLVHQA